MGPSVMITLPDASVGSALARADYRDLMAASPLALAVVDGSGRFVEANRAFTRLLSTTLTRLRDLRAWEVTHPVDQSRLGDALGPILAGAERSASVTVRLVAETGETVPTLAHLSGSGLDRGLDSRLARGGHVLMAAVDLSRQHDQVSQLAYAATHDPLTGLLNRAGLMTQLQTLLADGRDASVALLDVDKLKPVNDAYGHASGDRLLRQIGRALGDIARPDGVACRLAGDEFVVIADTTDEVALAQFLGAELGRLQVEVAPGVTMTPTASIGTAAVREGMTPSQVLAVADDSMYAVKRLRQEALALS